MQAYGGAIAILTGTIDFGSVITGRFPFGSPVFAAVALAAIVGIPMTVTTWCAVIGHRWTQQAAFVSGALLVGWIAVQMVIIQTFSWLQPTMVLSGLLVIGLRVARRTS